MGDKYRQGWGGSTTTKRPQDSGGQIDLEKTRAQFWTRGLDDSEPEQPENHQVNKVPKSKKKVQTNKRPNTTPPRKSSVGEMSDCP